ncbi:MAG: radical SAM family heme chaperone HemW [Oscillospiraceae bacterium]|nr:radical SAM family heme chaperone HemW [Oscillospiraceae bacterium]
MTGLYIHIPFCLQKCPYCDFYSIPYNDSTAYGYADAVIRNVERYNERYDTVYFGGGTPSAAWWDVCRIMAKLRFSDDAEITVEANPNTLTKESLLSMKNCGINRISIGAQSFSNGELNALGRSHTSEDASNSIKFAYESGFHNISVDLMLGIPNQSPDSVRRSIKILSALNVTHVSAYMLKVEPNTPLAYSGKKLPDENLTAQIYLAAVEALESYGFNQYEISNFAKKGFECRHNLKYWKSLEYLGIGAGAHSFYDNKRFFVAPDVKAFMKSSLQEEVITGKGGVSFEDYAMLKLRLVEGLTFAECEYFGVSKAEILKRCKLVPTNDLHITDKAVSMTAEGFLVSNRVIVELTSGLSLQK